YHGSTPFPDTTLFRSLRLAAYLCDAPFATFSVNDHSRERFLACHGCDVSQQLPLERGFADYVVSGNLPLIVTDTRKDPRFRHAPDRKSTRLNSSHVKI